MVTVHGIGKDDCGGIYVLLALEDNTLAYVCNRCGKTWATAMKLVSSESLIPPLDDVIGGDPQRVVRDTEA